MGQTLTHGVYLPDEGERNCYDGLAANWQLLDGAVGTVADHTAQIAGKAPAVHTHVTADVTDLLSGNHTWSGEQTFSQTIQGNAATASAFDTAKSITLTGAVTGTVSGTNSWEIATVLKTGTAFTGGTVPNPYFKIASWEVAPNEYFGAILQIQNKCYPHNAATLIISLRTKTNATFQMGYALVYNAIGIIPSDFILCYKEVTGKVLCELYYYTTTAFNGIRFSVISEGIQNDSSLFDVMTVYQSPSGISALPSDYTVIQATYGTYTEDFIPYSNNAYNLGSATNKWKTLNGVNPGALSLVDYNNILDVTSEVPVASLDGNTNIDLNNYIPNKTGWLSIVIANTAGNFINAIQGRAGTAAGFNASRTYHSGAADNEVISLFMPIIAGTWKSVYIKASSLIQMRFYYCLGNV